MNRFLTHLLMLVMLMPGLACGPFMSVSKAQAEEMQVEMPDCHGTAASHTNDGPMLFRDCAHADLQKTDHSNGLKKPDLSNGLFIHAFAVSATHNTFLPQDQSAIRGPPLDRIGLPRAPVSVLVTTQRFRE